MESFLDTLKQQVKCTLCNERLCDPRLLQCFHVCCKTCIKEHTQVNEEEDNIFKCPECNSQIPFQDLNDVEDLQFSSLHSRTLKVLELVENQKICSISSSHPEALSQCLDCNQSLCEECLRCHSKITKNHKVVSLCDLKKEDIEKLLKKEPPCKVHESNTVEFHCQDCDMLICLLCLKEGHRKHNTITLHEIIAVETSNLSKNLKKIDKLNTDEKLKNQQAEIALHTKTEGEKAKHQVKELTKKLIKTLKDNEQELLDTIEKSITKADRNLRVLLHTTQAQEYIKKVMENGTASELFDSRREKSSQNFTYEPFDPSFPIVEFKPNDDLCENVEYGLGQIRSSFKMAGPKLNSVKVDPSDLQAMRRAQLRVTPPTSNISLKNVQVRFTPKESVDVGKIQKTDDGNITVDFTPRVSGQMKAEILLHGNPTSYKPVDILVKPQQIKFLYNDLSRFLNVGSKNFTGIAVNKTNSMIAVADSESDCIRIFNCMRTSHVAYGIGCQLKYPQGLAFLNEKDLVIADSGNHRICIVNSVKQELLRTFGSFGYEPDKFNRPLGVYVDDHPNIIVCDHGNCRVKVFGKDGTYQYGFYASRPYSVVTLSNGLFYVTTNYGCNDSYSVICVIKLSDFNKEPTTVTTIGNKEYIGLQLQSHCGLAIDNDYNLLICDYVTQMIHKFTVDGRYIGRSGQLAKGPRYIAVLKDGVVMCTTGGGGVVFLM